MITQTLQLNLVPKGVWPRLYVSQYDAGSRTLTFEIYNGDQRFTLTSGTTAKIQGTKPDRHGFSYDADVDTSNNVITADITQQMTAAHGEAYCELVLFKSGQRIGTLNFVMMIQQAGLNDETDTSDSDLPDIIAEATEQMLTAEAYAKGTRNGTAVTSGQTGYHDNSKYYKEQAATQASNASTSATSANTNALKAEGYAVGKQNGTTQTSGTYYHNNAQYYKEQAASSATTASTKAGEASSSANTASQKASAASTSAQTASDKALVAEGYAKGTQNGTPVGSTSPYYHNNAEYFKNLANPTVAANVSFDNTGTDMSATNAQDGIVENRTSIQNLSNQVNYNTENGVKNILPITLKSKTANKVAITVNADGTITVNSVGGEASSGLVAETIGSFTGVTDIKLSGCPSGGNSSTYCLQLKQGSSYPVTETGSGATYTCDPSKTYEVVLVIRSGQTLSNKVFKPMVTLGFAPNSDYAHFQPYALSNQLLTQETTGLIDNTKANGCVNLYDAVGLFRNKDGLTSSIDDNGVITVNAGTASAQWYTSKDYVGAGIKNPLKEGKTYKYSIGLQNSAITLEVYYMATSTDSWHNLTSISSANAEYLEFTVPSTCYNLWLRATIGNGTVLSSNLTIKQMVTLASNTDMTFVPYAKTNRELTEDTTAISGTITNATGIANANANAIYKVGNLVVWNMFVKATAAIANGAAICTLPYKPPTRIHFMAVKNLTTTIILKLETTGVITLATGNLAIDDTLVATLAYETDV